MNDDCCSTNPGEEKELKILLTPTPHKPHPEASCPQCGQKGKAVQAQTVKALVCVPLNWIENTPYYFCRTQVCPTVYFTADGKSTFAKEQLRERVYQKEPDADDVFVCYCFRFTGAQIRNAAPEHQTSMVNVINAGIRANQCACDLRNPQGSCCLGNVREMLG